MTEDAARETIRHVLAKRGIKVMRHEHEPLVGHAAIHREVVRAARGDAALHVPHQRIERDVSHPLLHIRPRAHIRREDRRSRRGIIERLEERGEVRVVILIRVRLLEVDVLIHRGIRRAGILKAIAGSRAARVVIVHAVNVPGVVVGIMIGSPVAAERLRAGERAIGDGLREITHPLPRHRRVQTVHPQLRRRGILHGHPAEHENVRCQNRRVRVAAVHLKTRAPRPFLAAHERETEMVRRPDAAGESTIPHRRAIPRVLPRAVRGDEGRVHRRINLDVLTVVALTNVAQFRTLRRGHHEAVHRLRAGSPRRGGIVSIVHLAERIARLRVGLRQHAGSTRARGGRPGARERAVRRADVPFDNGEIRLRRDRRRPFAISVRVRHRQRAKRPRAIQPPAQRRRHGRRIVVCYFRRHRHRVCAARNLRAMLPAENHRRHIRRVH